MPSTPRTDTAATRGPSPRTNTEAHGRPPPVAREDALPPGTRVDAFEIEAVIGASGFGLVYLARDPALDRHVAVKEFLPDSLALRGGDGLQVRLRAPTHADAFERGRRAFIEEAELLSRCEHPSLLHVLRQWEANGTVYRAMPHYHGTALLALRQAMDSPPDEASLRALLDGLLEALATLHEAGCIHREITPANILLLPDDRPLLMDYGAARRAIVGDQARALMTLLAPSFAPPEQTAPSATRPIGAWTDLYALAAVVRYCISGQLPPPAALRTLPADEPIGRLVARLQQTDPSLHYSASFVAAIDAALAPRPEDRPHSVAEFRARLDDHPAAREERLAPEFDAGRDGSDREPKGDDPSSWGAGPTDQEPWFASTQQGEQDADAVEAELGPEETPWPVAEPESTASEAEPAQPAIAPAPSAGVADDTLAAIAAQVAAAHAPTLSDEPVAPRRAAPLPPQRSPDSPWAATSRPRDEDIAPAAPEMPAPEPFSARPSDYRATPPGVLSFREASRRRRRRLAWSTGALVLLAAGTGAWLLDQQRQTVEASSGLARAAKEDGLTANVPAVPRSLDAQEAKPAMDAATATADVPPSPAPTAAVATTQSGQVTPEPNAQVATAPVAAAAPPAATPPAATAPAAAPVVPTSAGHAADNEDEAGAPARSAAPRKAGKTGNVSGSGTRAAVARGAAAKAAVARTLAHSGPTGPRDVCGDRTQFSLYRCMQTQCARAQWVQHPSCKRLRLRDEVE